MSGNVSTRYLRLVIVISPDQMAHPEFNHARRSCSANISRRFLSILRQENSLVSGVRQRESAIKQGEPKLNSTVVLEGFPR